MLTDNKILSKETIDKLQDIIIHAGNILLGMYESPEGIEKKHDGTLVSKADKASSEYIISQLTTQFPDCAILDEETEDDGRRMTTRYTFVIDPLDNTNGYLKKNDNFGIIIGLTQDHVPVLGIAYKPMRKEIYWAIKGQGAFKVFKGKTERMKVSDTDDFTIVVSNSRRGEELESLFEKLQPTHIEYRGGSLKTLDVASGEFSSYIASPSAIMSVWDLCGPQIIVQEAGGILTDFYGNPIEYGATETRNLKGLIVASQKEYHKVLEATKSS